MRQTYLMGRVLLLNLALVLAIGCDDQWDVRLVAPLREKGIKQVVIDKRTIVATCGGGDTVEISIVKLDLNFLGKALDSKLSAVAKEILAECERRDTTRLREQTALALVLDEAKRLGIEVNGDNMAETKTSMCEKLNAELPASDPDRASYAALNSKRFGCAPPPPAPVDAGAWAMEIVEAVEDEPAQSFLRARSAKGEKLTLRCIGGKIDLYLQPSAAAKPGTTSIEARIDNDRSDKWQVKLSTDGKALFFTDEGRALEDLRDADAVSFRIPGKQPAEASFVVTGLADAMRRLPKPCR